MGNLSFYTTEEQIFDLFSKVGEIRRIIMGLDRYKKTPCGFCFVEYYRRIDAEKSVNFISNTKLDERTIRVDYDIGFCDDRQYGRGRSGGQVRDEHRVDYDPGRGGFGKAMAPQTGMSGMDMWGNSHFSKTPAAMPNGQFSPSPYNDRRFQRDRGRGMPGRGRQWLRGRGRGRPPMRGHPPGGHPHFRPHMVQVGGKRQRSDDYDNGPHDFNKRQRMAGYAPRGMLTHPRGDLRRSPPPSGMPRDRSHMMNDGPPRQREPVRNEKFDRGRNDDE